MTRSSPYILVSLGICSSFFGLFGILFGLPILFMGFMIVLRRSFGLQR